MQERSSFVSHKEYIEDLPTEDIPRYSGYIMMYGFYGIVPELDGYEKIIWKNIQRRIDADLQAYDNKLKKLKLSNQKRHLQKLIATSKDQIKLQHYWYQLEQIENLLESKDVEDFNIDDYLDNDEVGPYGPVQPRMECLSSSLSSSYNVSQSVSKSDEVTDEPVENLQPVENSEETTVLTDDFINTDSWLDENVPDIQQTSRNNIIKRLNTLNFDNRFLDYVLNDVKIKCKKTKLLTPYFVKAVTTWDDLANKYKIQQQNLKPVPTKKLIPHPDKCDICGAALHYEIGTKTWYCKNCHLTWELANEKWQRTG